MLWDEFRKANEQVGQEMSAMVLLDMHVLSIGKVSFCSLHIVMQHTSSVENSQSHTIYHPKQACCCTSLTFQYCPFCRPLLFSPHGALYVLALICFSLPAFNSGIPYYWIMHVTDQGSTFTDLVCPCVLFGLEAGKVALRLLGECPRMH